MNETQQIALLTKSWQIIQSLAKSNGEMAWKIRVWGLGIWSGLIVYAFNHQNQIIVGIALIQIITIFFIELSTRQIQYKFIERSLEIEKMLNDLIVGSEITLPSHGISTQINTPSPGELFKLLTIKRWLIWFPYLLLIVTTAITFYVI